MAIVDYATLQYAVGRWLFRDDLGVVIPDFIALAEAQFNRDLSLRAMESVVSGSLAGATVPIPSDANAVQSLMVGLSSGQLVALEYVPPVRVAEYSLYSGVARFYTEVGNALRVIPAPADASGTYTLYYQANFPALSNSLNTNFILSRYPDLYLYGALVAAAQYLGDERLAVWQAAYSRCVAMVQANDSDIRYPASMALSMHADGMPAFGSTW